MSRFRRAPSLNVRVGDLAALRLRISEISDADPDCAERLLGQVAALETHAAAQAPDDEIAFRPLAGCESMAERALLDLHAPAFAAGRRRRRRLPGWSVAR